MSKAAVAETHEESTAEGVVQKALSGPERLMEFLRETRAEMHKVVSPSWTEVQATTVVVVVSVFLFAAYFWLVDVVLGKGIDELLRKLIQH